MRDNGDEAAYMYTSLLRRPEHSLDSDHVRSKKLFHEKTEQRKQSHEKTDES